MTVTSDRADGGPTDGDRAGGSHLPSGAQPRAFGSVEVLRSARRLRATTVEIDPGSLPDIVRAGGGGPNRSLWSRSDLSLLGVGVALRLPLRPGWVDPANTSFVGEVLRAIATTDDIERSGSGPLAMGSLAYDPASGSDLRVPRLVVGHRPQVAWATLVAPSGAAVPPAEVRRTVEAQLAELRSEARPCGEPPDSFELTASMSHGQWKELVRRAVGQMEQGAFDKIVLARKVDVVANRPFVLHEVLARLASLYPSCTVFHFDGFIGASPETLIRRTGRDILSHPLAGTVARSGDSDTDEALLAGLMASAKDRREHQLVVDAITAQLGPLCSRLEVPAAPSVLALRNVSHLGTAITGILSDASGQSSQVATGLELAAVLQPTPAVGGHPTVSTLRWQRDNEGFQRGGYAGPVGWADTRGDGEWVLGLRSANLSGGQAALYAGSGIVVGSDPDTELAETQLKLQALLAALVRP